MLGADDYVSKPFKSRELIARVKARLRRTRTLDAVETSHILSARGILLDTSSHEATLHDQHFISHQRI